MKLRAALSVAVARCVPQYMQHATSTADDATADATGVQRPRTIACNATVLDATAGATPMQLASCTGATDMPELRVALANTCNTQPGPLTVHRLFADLMEAAMHACDVHGDSEQARSDMRADIEATPPHLRADLLAYFSATYRGNP